MYVSVCDVFRIVLFLMLCSFNKYIIFREKFILKYSLDLEVEILNFVFIWYIDFIFKVIVIV